MNGDGGELAADSSGIGKYSMSSYMDHHSIAVDISSKSKNSLLIDFVFFFWIFYCIDWFLTILFMIEIFHFFVTKSARSYSYISQIALNISQNSVIDQYICQLLQKHYIRNSDFFFPFPCKQGHVFIFSEAFFINCIKITLLGDKTLRRSRNCSVLTGTKKTPCTLWCFQWHQCGQVVAQQGGTGAREGVGEGNQTTFCSGNDQHGQESQGG